MQWSDEAIEAATQAISLFEVFTASDGMPGIRMVERSQDEVVRLVLDAAAAIQFKNPIWGVTVTEDGYQTLGGPPIPKQPGVYKLFKFDER